MFIAIMTVSLIALLLDVKYKHSFVLLGLNIAGGTASTLGIIVYNKIWIFGPPWKIIFVAHYRYYIMVSSRSNCLLLFYCRRRGTY